MCILCRVNVSKSTHYISTSMLQTFGNRFNRLSRGTGDEEPLVNGSVDLLRRKLLVGRKLGELVLAHTAGGVGYGGVGAAAC